MLMGESPSNSTFYMKKIKKIISVLCKSEKCHSGYHNLVGYSVFLYLRLLYQKPQASGTFKPHHVLNMNPYILNKILKIYFSNEIENID